MEKTNTNEFNIVRGKKKGIKKKREIFSSLREKKEIEPVGSIIILRQTTLSWNTLSILKPSVQGSKMASG